MAGDSHARCGPFGWNPRMVTAGPFRLCSGTPVGKVYTDGCWWDLVEFEGGRVELVRSLEETSRAR